MIDPLPNELFSFSDEIDRTKLKDLSLHNFKHQNLFSEVVINYKKKLKVLLVTLIRIRYL